MKIVKGLFLYRKFGLTQLIDRSASPPRGQRSGQRSRAQEFSPVLGGKRDDITEIGSRDGSLS